MEKVSLFVDVQNIYYTTRSVYQRNFDYNKFWARATQDRQTETLKRVCELIRRHQNLTAGTDCSTWLCLGAA